MEILDRFNAKTICPICETTDEGKAVLVFKSTATDWNEEESVQIHLDCLSLRIAKTAGSKKKIIYQYL